MARPAAGTKSKTQMVMELLDQEGDQKPASIIEYFAQLKPPFVMDAGTVNQAKVKWKKLQQEQQNGLFGKGATPATPVATIGDNRNVAGAAAAAAAGTSKPSMADKVNEFVALATAAPAAVPGVSENELLRLALRAGGVDQLKAAIDNLLK